MPAAALLLKTDFAGEYGVVPEIDEEVEREEQVERPRL